MTRDEAVQVAVEALAAWHDQDHGLRCTCVEGERFGYQASAVIDALIAGASVFEPSAALDLSDSEQAYEDTSDGLVSAPCQPFARGARVIGRSEPIGERGSPGSSASLAISGLEVSRP